jgi:hypothetical protein
MTRIDLFTAPGCSTCPSARVAIRAFAEDHPGTEVHEWDLTRDPGPAVGRGIFIAPTVLVNLTYVLVGVPERAELVRAAAAWSPEPARTPPMFARRASAGFPPRT